MTTPLISRSNIMLLGVCLAAASLVDCTRSSSDRSAAATTRDTTSHVVTQQETVTVKTPPPGGDARQDSLWRATLSKWEREKPRRLLLIDTVPRTYAYARDHISMASIWGLQILTPDRAKALSSDPAAANGAYLIITKGHVPHTTPRLNVRP